MRYLHNHYKSNLEGDRRLTVKGSEAIEKGVLINFAKFTGKHLCQRLFFNKVADLMPGVFM